MSAPSMTTTNPSGNLLAASSLPANGALTFNVDASGIFEVQIQIGNTGGASVSTTSGVTVNAYRRIGNSAQVDSIPVVSFTIPTTSNTTAYESLALPTGRWQIQLVNLDTVNAVTVIATSDTVDKIQ